MRLPLLLSLSLSLFAALPAAFAQALPADEFFHNGAQSYLSNNIPAALQVVTNGRAIYPDDEKLKKLEELLKQQQQQQQQQDQQKQDQDKKDQDKKDQQQKDQQKDQQQKPQQSKQDKQKSDEQKESKPGQMTPAQAARLLDAQKGEEEALVFKPEDKPKDETKPVKDW